MDPFEDLLDELVAEILCRLPCSKNVVRCKSVTKRWRDIISEPYFISHFILCRATAAAAAAGSSSVDQISELRYNLPFCIVYNPYRLDNFPPLNRNQVGMLMYVDDEQKMTETITYPPWCSPGEKVLMVVQGACNDLLLCSLNSSKNRDYRVYNVRTNQCIHLPDPPYRKYTLNVAFVSEPLYAFDESNNVIINKAPKHYVVHFREYDKKRRRTKIYLYSSAVGQWAKLKVWSPKTFLWGKSHRQVFVYDKMMYFYGILGIFRVTPHERQYQDGVIKGHFIDWPVERAPNKYFEKVLTCFGGSSGRIQLSEVERSNNVLSVWELVDQNTGSWVLKYKFCFKQMVLHNSDVFALVQDNPDRYVQQSLWLIGFHPSHKHLMYLQMATHIICCDLHERTLKVICRVPVNSSPSDFSWLLYPWWPTPLLT